MKIYDFDPNTKQMKMGYLQKTHNLMFADVNYRTQESHYINILDRYTEIDEGVIYATSLSWVYKIAPKKIHIPRISGRFTLFPQNIYTLWMPESFMCKFNSNYYIAYSITPNIPIFPLLNTWSTESFNFYIPSSVPTSFLYNYHANKICIGHVFANTDYGLRETILSNIPREVYRILSGSPNIDLSLRFPFSDTPRTHDKIHNLLSAYSNFTAEKLKTYQDYSEFVVEVNKISKHEMYPSHSRFNKILELLLPSQTTEQQNWIKENLFFNV